MSTSGTPGNSSWSPPFTEMVVLGTPIGFDWLKKPFSPFH
jgi:hypothetical protein